MNLRWLIDPESARENPRRVQLGLVIGGAVAGAAVGYLRLADHDALKTLLAALVGSLAGLVVARRVLGGPTAVSRSHVFQIVLAVLGAAVVILGIAVDDMRVVLSAIPLWLFAAAVFVARRRIARRQ